VKKANLFFPAFLFCISSVLFLSGCGRIGTGSNEDIKPGGVLVAGIKQLYSDPYSLEFRKSAKLLNSSIYETLLCLVTGLDGPQAMLAESWEISDDRLEYVFHIKKGVFFHDKTPLDAQSAAASLKRLKNPDNGNIREVEAVEKNILKITLFEPDPFFLFTLTDSEAAVTHSDKSSGSFSFPAGTGPFMISSISESDPGGVSFFTDRFDDYHGKKPYIDRLVFRFIPESSALYLALKAGDIDFIEVPDVMIYGKVKDNSTFKTYSWFGGEVLYIFFNPESFFFSKKELRLAAASAFNRNDFISKAFDRKPVFSADNFPYPYRFTGSGSDRIPFDKEKSEKLIYDSGYKNILNAALYSDTADNGENTVSAIKEQLETAGFNIKIFTDDSAGADIAASGWLNIRENPSRLDKWDAADDNTYSELLYSALISGDQEAAASFYSQAADYLAEEVSWFPAACSLNIYSMGLNVAGISFRPDGLVNMADLWIKK